MGWVSSGSACFAVRVPLASLWAEESVGDRSLTMAVGLIVTCIYVLFGQYSVCVCVCFKLELGDIVKKSGERYNLK